jgi:hypothetical protein
MSTTHNPANGYVVQVNGLHTYAVSPTLTQDAAKELCEKLNNNLLSMDVGYYYSTVPAFV